MAIVAGYNGAVSVTGGAAFTFTSWSIDASALVVQTDGFGDEWEAAIGGKKSWTATATARLDAALNALTIFGGAAVAVEFTTTTGIGYTGNAVVTDANPGVSHDGDPEITFQFKGSGALTPDTT